MRPTIGGGFRRSSPGCCGWQARSKAMPRTLRTLLARLRGLAGTNHLDDEFDREVGGHLELLAERYERQGMSREDALYAAPRQFVGVTNLNEDLRWSRRIQHYDVL